MGEKMPKVSYHQVKDMYANPDKGRFLDIESKRPHSEPISWKWLEEAAISFGLWVAQEQCKLLAEQGWVRLPSEETIADKLVDLSGSDSGLDRDYFREDAKELHRWLQEGGKSEGNKEED